MNRSLTALLIPCGVIVALYLSGKMDAAPYTRWSWWLPGAGLNDVVDLPGDRACNPTAMFCTAGNAALTISLRLGDGIRPLRVFPVTVRLTGKMAARVGKVAVNFTMADMDMGFNQFALSPQADGTWQGQALLPVCSAGRSDWRVRVEVAADRVYAGEFYLRAGP